MASLHTRDGRSPVPRPARRSGFRSGVASARVSRRTAAAFTIGRSKGWMWGNRNQPLRVTVLMSVQPHPLEGRKILIVEDEAPIALSLAAAVAHAGGIAIGPAATVAAAFALMADHTLDGALLDIRLRGETSFSAGRRAGRAGHSLRVRERLVERTDALSASRPAACSTSPTRCSDVIATLARLLRPAATPAPSTSGATPGGSPR